MTLLNIAVCNAAPLNGLFGLKTTIASHPVEPKRSTYPCSLVVTWDIAFASFSPLNNMLKFSGYSCLL